MSYDRYQIMEEVGANRPVHAPKGVMVVGNATGATLHPFATPNYASGLTGYAVKGASGDGVQIDGSLTGTIFPVAVAYIGALEAGTKVYTLA